ncbi:MAG: outer membrane protein assembly factor BamE [Pseudomonadota bacterium]
MTKYTPVLGKYVLLFILASGLSACGGYKINVLQGNYLDQEKINQVESGMTRNQVKYLLGTPMIADSFHENRWDYVYQFRIGKTGQVIERKVTIYFEGDTVQRVEQYGQNPDTETALSES